MSDPYEILGINRSATEAEISAKFRSLAKKYHPDINKTKGAAEKLRINMAILLSWRTISKMRNSVSTNLLCLDEILDGALDGIGVETLIDTLHNLNSNDNIFVISHRGELFSDKFKNHIEFEKVKNFSQLKQKE